jgi:hypothetical protein
MRTKVIAVAIGASVTLLLWVIAFGVLNAVYRGNLPWLLAGLAAFLCPLAGGGAAAGLDRRSAARTGALSGALAGVVALLAVATASGLTPNSTLAGTGFLVVGTLGGGLGARLAGASFVQGQ